MSEKIKISVVMDDEKPSAEKEGKSEKHLVLTQETDVTLMSVLLKNRLMSGSFCGGRGDCGRCVIQFLEGTPLPTGLERARFTPEELRQGYRLACVARPKRDCTVRIIGGGDERLSIVTEVNLPSEIIDQNSQENKLSENQKSDAMEYRNGQEVTSKKLLKKSSVISKTQVGVMEFSENHKKDGMLENGRYMIAVDLGTTTIAMQLRDMVTGAAADTYCEKNPQSIYGTDVLARIEASNSGSGAELQRLACEALTRGYRQFEAWLRKKASRESGAGEEAQIACMCIAGNTAMQHLLLGYDVEGLGKAPFLPVEKGLQRVPAYQIFQGIGEKFSGIGAAFPVYIAPCISAFVGGDIVAGLYALHLLPGFSGGEKEDDGAILPNEGQGNGKKTARPDERREEDRQTALLLDLGTNGEMAITDGQRMIVTATAAGPAFEGKGDLIGTDRIALTAALLQQGILDETGLMAEPYFQTGVPVAAGKRDALAGEIRLVKDIQNAKEVNENECYFRKEDVRALQMAKAAVRAGVEILWEEMGRPYIDRVYLAGGFGYYLDVEASIAIGLLPVNMRGRVQAVGNTSLAGAYELGCALSQGKLAGELLEKKLSDVKSINLAKKEQFEKLYLSYMNLEEN